ncbi:hypothetical protein BKA70DRAFT_1230858 [Coprinopsis sp. MPI-PUGE-AT-0042]|nr:hypothetical protein BKA70DRAFT_1230858 [Coprinopsis sp. MPI-PUGE-AT-0042]
MPESEALTCAACGKIYTLPQFLNEHEHTGCKVSKQNLHAILETSKSLWEARKRRRLDNSPVVGPSSTFQDTDEESNDVAPAIMHQPQGNLDQKDVVDDRPITIQCTRCTIKKPGTRFFDTIPAPFAPILDLQGVPENGANLRVVGVVKTVS